MTPDRLTSLSSAASVAQCAGAARDKFVELNRRAGGDAKGILRAAHPHWIERDRILASAGRRSRLTRDIAVIGRIERRPCVGMRCRSRSPVRERATACRCESRISED